MCAEFSSFLLGQGFQTMPTLVTTPVNLFTDQEAFPSHQILTDSVDIRGLFKTRSTATEVEEEKLPIWTPYAIMVFFDQSNIH